MWIVGLILVGRWLLSHRAQPAPAKPDDDEDEPVYVNVSCGTSGGMRPPDIWPALGMSQVFRSKEFPLCLQEYINHANVSCNISSLSFRAKM